jgi:hypothetical protein
VSRSGLVASLGVPSHVGASLFSASVAPAAESKHEPPDSSVFTTEARIGKSVLRSVAHTASICSLR